MNDNIIKTYMLHVKGHGRSQKALLCLQIHIDIFLFKFYLKGAIKNRNFAFFMIMILKTIFLFSAIFLLYAI